MKKNLKTSCIGSIPQIKPINDQPILLTHYSHHYMFKESLFNLRHEIESDCKNNNHKVFMVTSCVPHEGKSTTASNIALSLAHKGHKVMLLDFDLRNPTLHKIFSIGDSLGLIDCLEKNQLNKSYIKIHSEYPNLSLLVSSHASQIPTELLSQAYVSKLIQRLKNEYDYIILDTPPIHLMDDTYLIARHAESMILVLRQDYLPVAQITESLDRISRMHAPLLGCVINRVESREINTSSKYEVPFSTVRSI